MEVFMKGLKAFTLAEVLLALLVIGIVAVLTIPSMVQSYKEKVTVTKVKKAYAVMQEAFKLAIIENGYVDNWGLTGVYVDEDDHTQISQEGSAKFARIFSRYLNKSRICDGDLDCVGGYKQKLLNGDEYEIGAQGASSVILNDGIAFVFTPWMYSGVCSEVSACGSIAVYTDISKTTHYGVNSFTFYLYKDKIVPWGSSSLSDSDANSFYQKCIYGGSNFENGLGCTGWVLEVGNMDYLHCAGLSYDGKRSCKQK